MRRRQLITSAAPLDRLACGCFINCPGPAYHAAEATRIQGELDRLGPEFPEDSAVRVILRERIADEQARGVELCEIEGCPRPRGHTKGSHDMGGGLGEKA
jgi:hypothetical protein